MIFPFRCNWYRVHSREKKSRELFCVILRIPILQILTPDVNCCVSFLRNWIITAACNDSQNNFSSLLTCDNDDNLSLFDTVFEVFLLLLLCYRCKLLPALSIVISQIIGDFLFMCAFVCLYVFRKFIWIFNIGNRRWRGEEGHYLSLILKFKKLNFLFI